VTVQFKLISLGWALLRFSALLNHDLNVSDQLKLSPHRNRVEVVRR
jgi:hypothetical protein